MPEIRSQRQALTEARRVLGNEAAIRYDRTAAHKADREAAGRLAMELRTAAEIPTKRATLDHLRSVATSYRCTVGVIVRGYVTFFSIKGQGDTWQEAIDNAAKR